MTKERLYNEHYQIENFYGGFVDANDIINDNAQAEPTNRVLAEPFESEGAEEWQMPIRLVDGRHGLLIYLFVHDDIYDGDQHLEPEDYPWDCTDCIEQVFIEEA